MPPENLSGSPQLFQFKVPGLPDTSLALGLPEVLEITRLPEPTPVPFASPFILGLSEWRGNIVTALDLSSLLNGVTGATNGTTRPAHDPDLRHLVAQFIVDARREVVSWPVLPGAGPLTVPPRVPHMHAPADLRAEMVRTAISLSDQTFVLLNLDQLAGSTSHAMVR
jgi:chemotaxis signal transduction protein